MTEQRIQSEIFKYFHNNYCLKTKSPQYKIFAVPNGGSRNMLEAINLKSTGVIAGVSDLIIVLKNKIIFCEVKTETGKQSDKQLDFQNVVQNLNHKYIIVRSLQDFINQIENEL